MSLNIDCDAAPFADRVKLPSRPSRGAWISSMRDPVADPLPALCESLDGDGAELIRPSLCVQAREGRLHVFLPYAPSPRGLSRPGGAVEDTCQYLEQPVWVEGYAPPADPRLRSFSVTPDPGVLEVNLPPASNWDELEQINTMLDRRGATQSIDR